MTSTGYGQLIPDEVVRSVAQAAMGRVLEDIVDADIYVSPNGRLEWSGRLREPNSDRTDGPLPTVEAARDALRRIRAAEKPKNEAGWVVLIAPGTYELEGPLVFGPEDSGTSDAPIVYACLSKEGATISGGRRITGWKIAEVNGKKVWAAELADVKAGQWYPRQLFVNNERRPRTRLPKEGYLEFAGLPQMTEKTPWNEGQTEATFKAGEIKRWRNLGDVEVVALHFWIESRLPLAEVNEADNIAKFERKSTFRLTDAHNHQQFARYYVENVFEALDAPGQWYVDRPTGMLYYVPMPGETPEDTLVMVPRLPQLLRVVGDRKNDRPVKSIVFLGLDFCHADWSLPAEKAGSVQAAFEVPGALYFQDADSCTVFASRIRHVSGYAVEFASGCANNSVEGCELTDLGAGGVKMWEGSSHSRIHNNEIGPGGLIFHSAVGVLIGPSGDNTVTHNEIHDFSYTGISVGWSWGYNLSPAVRNIVEYNHIHDIGKGMLSDMGGIYTLGVSPNTRLRYNLIHDVEAHTYGGWGIYNDEGSTHILIENNIVYRTKHAGYHQHYGKENYIRNNIFAFGREAQLARSREEEHVSFIFERNIILFDHDKLLTSNWKNDKFVIDYNLYWRTDSQPFDFAGVSFEEWRRRGHDTHSIIADPQFVDPTNGDFSFKPGSPAHQIGFQPIDTSKIGRSK
ncbi:MAG: right-handed parallel beta-helix repeat-containing protein [Phycisphaerae bacterium]